MKPINYNNNNNKDNSLINVITATVINKSKKFNV